MVNEVAVELLSWRDVHLDELQGEGEFVPLQSPSKRSIR
jgi:hypothetical protein